MEQLLTQLMVDTQRAAQLIGRNPGLSVIMCGDHDGALGLYEARVDGRLFDVDTRLTGLLDRLEAAEETRTRSAWVNTQPNPVLRSLPRRGAHRVLESGVDAPEDWRLRANAGHVRTVAPGPVTSGYARAGNDRPGHGILRSRLGSSGPLREAARD
jgi:hypothetical protein